MTITKPTGDYMPDDNQISKYDRLRGNLQDVALFTKPSTIKNVQTITGEAETFVVETCRHEELGDYIFIDCMEDTWVKSMAGMSDHEKLAYISRYRNGDLANDTNQRRECLVCNVFGPSVAYSIACFYHRAAGGNIIVWDEEIDSLESKHNLFEQYLVPPWWDTDKKPVVS